jgi:hypothetical protein
MYIGSYPSDRTSGAKPRDEFTGDGSTVNFTLSQEVPGAFESNVLVIVDNVLQQPVESYTIGGDNITLQFSEAPASGAVIYVLHQGTATYQMIPVVGSVTPDKLSENLRNFTVDTFTGNGSTVAYTLSATPASANSILVIVDGIVQTRTTNYSLSGTTLTFASAPDNASAITVIHLGFSTVSRTAVPDGSITTAKIADNAITSAKLGFDVIVAEDIAANAITVSELQNGAVTPAKLSTGGPSWDTSSNVGIGTSSPAYRLHAVTAATETRQNLSNISRTTSNWVRFTNPQFSVDASMGLLLRVFPESDARQGAGILASGGDNNGNTNLSLFVSSGTTTSSSFATYTTTVSGSDVIHTFNKAAGSEAVRISSAGDVGIGTSSPASRLSVTGSANIATFDGGATTSITLTGSTRSDIFLIDSGAATDQKRLTIRGDGGNLIFGVENDIVTAFTERMRIDSSGRVTKPLQPSFLVTLSSSTDVTVSAGNNIAFNSTTGGFNIGNHFNTSTNVFTAPVSGRYWFSYHVFITSSSGSGFDQQAAIAKNNSYVSGSDAIGVLNYNPSAYNGSFTSAIILDLAANDTVSVKGRTNLRIYQGHCLFQGYLIG